MARRKNLIGLVIVCALLSNVVVAPACLAQDDQARKLGRGVANLTGGWLSLFTTIEETGKSDGILAGATYGFIKGIINAVQRTLVGAYETLTFPFPIPKDYKPILTNPEFPLGKETKE